MIKVQIEAPTWKKRNQNENLSQWGIFKMAIPYAWLARIFQTQALTLENNYNIMGANNLVFLLIVSQFFFVVLLNHFYLGEKTTRSEIFAIFLLIIAYSVNNYNVVSNLLNIPVYDASGNLLVWGTKVEKDTTATPDKTVTADNTTTSDKKEEKTGDKVDDVNGKEKPQG
jgi:hypothetical protein